MHALIATGTPVVVVLLSGRPFALGSIVVEQGGEGAAAVVQAFFPGQLGGAALARILSGAANPSGRLPVSTPRESGSQPGTDLTAPLGRRTEVSNIDPTPLSGFGHGLTSSTFERSAAAVRRESHRRTDGSVRRADSDERELPVENGRGPALPARSCGPRSPVLWPGSPATCRCCLHGGVGALELLFGASYEEIRSVAALHLEDQERAVDHSGVLTVAPHR